MLQLSITNMRFLLITTFSPVWQFLLDPCCRTCYKLKIKACIQLRNDLRLTFAKGINKSWKTGMLNSFTQKHLHILSKTTAIEYSNQLIQSMSQWSFTQNPNFWKSTHLYTENSSAFSKNRLSVSKKKHSRATNVKLTSELTWNLGSQSWNPLKSTICQDF